MLKGKAFYTYKASEVGWNHRDVNTVNTYTLRDEFGLMSWSAVDCRTRNRESPGPGTINVFLVCLGAQLTICAQN